MIEKCVQTDFKIDKLFHSRNDQFKKEAEGSCNSKARECDI